VEKARIAAEVVTRIREQNPAGRFLKEDPANNGMWLDIGDEKARKKAGQALREDAPDLRAAGMAKKTDSPKKDLSSPPLQSVQAAPQGHVPTGSTYNEAQMQQNHYSQQQQPYAGSGPQYNPHPPLPQGGYGFQAYPPPDQGQFPPPQFQGQNQHHGQVLHHPGSHMAGAYSQVTGNAPFPPRPQPQDNNAAPIISPKTHQMRRTEKNDLNQTILEHSSSDASAAASDGNVGNVGNAPPPNANTDFQRGDYGKKHIMDKFFSQNDQAKFAAATNANPILQNSSQQPPPPGLQFNQRRAWGSTEYARDSAASGSVSSSIFSSNTSAMSNMSSLTSSGLDSRGISMSGSGQLRKNSSGSNQIIRKSSSSSGSSSGKMDMLSHGNTKRNLSPISSVDEENGSLSQPNMLKDTIPEESSIPSEANVKEHTKATAARESSMRTSDLTFNMSMSNIDPIPFQRSLSFPNLSDIDMLSIGDASVSNLINEDAQSGVSSNKMKDPFNSPAEEGEGVNASFHAANATAALGGAIKMSGLTSSLRSGGSAFGPHGRSRVGGNGRFQSSNISNISFNIEPTSIYGANAAGRMSVASDDNDSSSSKSNTSSWLKPFKAMQSVGSEFNPWQTESNRSILSDISADLMALDLYTDNRPPEPSNLMRP